MKPIVLKCGGQLIARIHQRQENFGHLTLDSGLLGGSESGSIGSSN